MESDLQKAYLDSLEKNSTSSKKDHKPKLWVVSSGKGGVGKTFISTSLGVTLSKLGHSVVIIDLDLSGANVHTSLGIKPSNQSIRDFFEGTKSLEQLKKETSFARLSFVQGIFDSWVPTEITIPQINSLVEAVKKLSADYVVVDLGAGAQAAHLELFSAADEKFLITTPDPTSIEKNYRFIESYFCYSIRSTSTPEAYHKLISNLQSSRNSFEKKPFSFRFHQKLDAGIQFDYFAELMRSPVRIIVNTSRSKCDSELGLSIKSVCNKYYDLNTDFIGSIDYDNAVWRSLQGRQHIFAAQPFTPLAGQFLSICKHLIDPEELRAVI